MSSIKTNTKNKTLKIAEEDDIIPIESEELVELSEQGDEVDENEDNVSLELQLGDIIQLTDPENERINGQTFLIEYINSFKIHLVNTEDFDSINLQIQPNGVIEGITKIVLLSRTKYPGYAKQNELVPGKWINIYFNGEVPFILTGEITNLEEDMIELRVEPDKETIFINFDYKGLPEDLPIEKIEIRSPVSKEKEKEEREKLVEEEEEIREEEPQIQKESLYVEPSASNNVKNQLREIILNADQIVFGKEGLGAIRQFVDVQESKQRYSIDVQVNDLLNDLLSTIPNQQRSKRVLNEIHIMLERYKQLRSEYSSFDEYGNVNGKIKIKANEKPLTEYLEKFNRVLYWILPVTQNVKKIYNINTLARTADVVVEWTELNLESIKEIIQNYSDRDYPKEQNRYEIFMKSLNPYFTPFESLEPEVANNQVIIDKNVAANLNVVMNNLMDFYSSSVADNRISSKRFLMEKYITGMTKLQTLPNRSVSGVVTNGVILTERIEITDPDVLSIQSILTLPEPVVRFSQINLPGTSIFERANLNLSFLNYWALLKKNVNVKDFIIDNLKEEVHYEEDEFLQKITQYSLSDELQITNEVTNKVRNGITKEEKYNRFVQCIIPKTRILFHLIRKYIHGKLSIVDVVQYLEPFLIYTKNISYMQYLRITRFIYNKIREYNRSFAERSAAFSSLKRNKNLNSSMNQERTNVFLEVLGNIVLEQESTLGQVDEVTSKEKINLKTDVMEKYQISKNVPLSTLEFIHIILLKDSSRFYFSSLSLQLIDLMFPNDFSLLLEKEKDKSEILKNDGSKGECADVVIAKMYANEDELMADNGLEIYFDQKYDTTNYGLLENYESQMIQMPTEDFLTFLMDELQKKLKLSKEEAENMADTLISGYKRVLNGHYAIIHQATPEGEYKFVYYKRDGQQQWVRDNELTEKGIKTDNGSVLCNLEEKCISLASPKPNNDGQCESVQVNELQLKEKLVKNILGEFDHQYEVSKRQLKKILTDQFLYYQDILPIWNRIEWNSWLKPNVQKYKIGLKIEKEEEASTHIIVSRYAKLRDLILGQQDFVKKQADLLRFVDTYTREPYLDIIGPLGEKESPYWLYCLETNAKLLPSFFFILASAWTNEPGNYLLTIGRLIKEIGVLGDDEESWVDKHSGYVICKRDYSIDEGFEDGYRVSTNAIVEEDAEDKIRNALLENGVGITDKERKIVQNTPEMKMINNVINAVCSAMAISLESQKDWMISDIVTLLKDTVPSESVYNKQVKEMANKGKTIVSFKELYHNLLLYHTLGLIVVAIQTSIPSIRTRRTFPGCIRSFTGYPLEGVGDLSTVNYLACIAYKIRSSADPWKGLTKKKETAIAGSIKDIIDKYLLGLDTVKRKMEEKMEYLLTIGEGMEIEEQYDIRRWTQFLPPLVPFQMKGLQPVSPEFEKTLLQELKSGSSLQTKKIGVMEGKVILFSLAIQEKINAIVEKKEVVLRKMTNEPYLENACCNERSGQEKRVTCLEYFEKEDATIASYNQIVLRLSNVFKDIFFYSSASLLYSPFNTKNIYPPVDMKFSERTIYKAFIDFCHFQSLKPIPADLIPLCIDKPDFLKSGENLTEMIVKLKNDGRQFNYENFLRLLQMVSRNRIVVVDTEKPLISVIQHMRDAIEILEDQNDSREKALLERLIPLLDTYDLGAENSKAEVRSLNNYLSTAVDSMKRELSDFIVKNRSDKMTKNVMKSTRETIQMLNIWEIGKDIDSVGKEKEKEVKGNDVKEKETSKSVYRILEFYKEYIDNFIRVFPSIIQNRLNYENIQIPKYWGLSQNHNRDIVKIVNDYYQGLRSFYDVKVLSLLLSSISGETENLLLLAEKTPCFTGFVDKEGKKVEPIFNERTSKMMFEYYLLKVMKVYMDLTEDGKMIVVEKNMNPSEGNVNNRTYNERILNEPIYTNDFVEEVQTNLDTVPQVGLVNDRLFIGNKKELKQKTSDLLVVFLTILQKHKETVDVPYEKFQDRNFQLKQREKNAITDRLQDFTDEKHDVDTMMKINKLGDWGKGLQKGLTSYVKENYDQEREFMEQMMQYERDFSRKRRTGDDEDGNLEDYIEQIGRDQEAEKEAYDISNMTEDYTDDYEPNGYEEEEDYNDYN